MPKVPKISLHIFAVSPEKHGVWNWFSLPADKHKNFLQIDSITLDVHIHACPKYLGQEVYNIFAISQEKCKRWTWFLCTDNCQRLLQSDTIILDIWMPKLSKIKSFLFLCNILRKK